jgi:hypothetical protein
MCKRSMFIIALSLVALVLGACGQKESASKEPQKDQEQDSLTIVLTGEQGKSVADILGARHEVRILASARGMFIKAIDGVENTGEYNWVYTVNGKPATVAADQYITEPGDTIRWHYRKSR